MENTGLKQSLDYVQSMDRAVEASKAQVEFGQGQARLCQQQRRSHSPHVSIQNRHAGRIRTSTVAAKFRGASNTSKTCSSSARSRRLQAATALLPTGIRQYIERKDLKHDVLKMQLDEANVRLKESQRDKGRGELRSPVDGVVLERAISDERPGIARHRAAENRPAWKIWKLRPTFSART